MGFEVRNISSKALDTKIGGKISIIDRSDLERLIVLSKEALTDKCLLEDMVSNIDKLRNDISSLTAERDTLKEENERLLKLISRSTSNIKDMIDERDVMKGILESVSDERDAMKGTLQSMIDERDTIKRERDILKEKLDSLVGETKGVWIRRDNTKFEEGRSRYDELGNINRTRIVALATKGVKPSSIVEMIKKPDVNSESGMSENEKYTKRYISTVYSPRNDEELDRLLGMCKRYIDYTDGVSYEEMESFILKRYNRKMNRKRC